MRRKALTAVVVLVAAGWLAGCENWNGNSTADKALQVDNDKLRQQVYDLNNDNSSLRRDVAAAEGAVAEQKLEVERWKAKHAAARSALEAGAQGLPPELLQKFIQIARGPWEIAGGGTHLKASSDILFDSGKATLKPAGEAALRDIAPKLKEILTDKRVMLRIDGHTDNTPIKISGWKDNMALSQARARAVWVSLRGMGLAAETMCANGYGEFHPIADNSDEEGQGKNRRVELSLVSIAPTAAAPTNLRVGRAIGGDTKSTLIGAGAGAIGGYIIGNELDKPGTDTPAPPAP